MGKRKSDHPKEWTCKDGLNVKLDGIEGLPEEVKAWNVGKFKYKDGDNDTDKPIAGVSHVKDKGMKVDGVDKLDECKAEGGCNWTLWIIIIVVVVVLIAGGVVAVMMMGGGDGGDDEDDDEEIEGEDED